MQSSQSVYAADSMRVKPMTDQCIEINIINTVLSSVHTYSI